MHALGATAAWLWAGKGTLGTISALGPPAPLSAARPPSQGCPRPLQTLLDAPSWWNPPAPRPLVGVEHLSRGAELLRVVEQRAAARQLVGAGGQDVPVPPQVPCPFCPQGSQTQSLPSPHQADLTFRVFTESGRFSHLAGQEDAVRSR